MLPDVHIRQASLGKIRLELREQRGRMMTRLQTLTISLSYRLRRLMPAGFKKEYRGKA
jgi:hypothetical protein